MTTALVFLATVAVVVLAMYLRPARYGSTNIEDRDAQRQHAEIGAMLDRTAIGHDTGTVRGRAPLWSMAFATVHRPRRSW
ncbi:hypothetical protein [Nocardia sp. NPDC052566]|uniref:hypothetical protein n=1 Tax=Nocardia sp. NPDC052566 TaxID=3364330 RepID=UPI0037C7C391